MQYKISGVRLKELPSKFGGTWKLAEVKIEGRGDTKFELQGYGSKFVEKIKEGEVIHGYESTKTYNGVVTPTINKITAEYVYDIVMKMQDSRGEPQLTSAVYPSDVQTDEQNDNW